MFLLYSCISPAQQQTKKLYKPTDKQPHTHTHTISNSKNGGGGSAVVLNPCIWAESQTDFPQQIHTCNKRAVSSNNILISTPFD